MTAPASLADVRDERGASLYPQQLLEGIETALVLFAAGFHGRQDAVWVAEAGVHGTCVDIDVERLSEMGAVYPVGWVFCVKDAFAYARTWRSADRQWDLVSIDCPSNLFDRCAAELPLWCDIARCSVVLGTGVNTEVVAPAGWKVGPRMPRSGYLGGVFWTVLERSW